MSRRLSGFSNIATATALLVLAAGVHTIQPSLASPGSDHAAAIQRLSQYIGIPVERLDQASVSEESLLDGTRLVTVKAIDREATAIVGTTFLNGRAVDRREVVEQAGASWREVNGAITPSLLQRVMAMSDDDRIEVDLWFKYDPPEVLDHKGPDRIEDDAPPAGLLAKLAETLAAEGEAAQWSAGRDAGKQAQEPALSPEAAAAVLASAATAPAPAGPEPQVDREKQDVPGPEVVIPDELLVANDAAFAELEAGDAQRLAVISADLASIRQPLSDRLASRGIQTLHVSEVFPSITLVLDRRQILELSRWPEIDALYVLPDLYGEELSNARPTQNANLVNDVGYNGTGVIVSVSEGGRVFGENPFLTVDSYCNAGAAGAAHATAVAGFIASTHATHRGLASGVTLRNANCANVNAIIDWGVTNARVLNHSFFSESSPGTADFTSQDRRLDYAARYHFDTPVKSAGNVGNGCVDSSGFVSDFVTSPGKGYNTVAVGNFNDLGSLTWTGDAMANCSSFGNPSGDNTTGRHEKPELAASGTNLTSTTVSSNTATAVGGVGSGTSYAAPMVSATAANIIQADSVLAVRPEVIKPVLMAGAMHNIEGASALSDRDGAGGLVASASLAIVERGAIGYRQLTGAGDFPFTHHVLAKQGERVRFAIHWQSNPNAAYTSDPRPPDVDLRAYRGDGTTLVASSISSFNPFEIIEFTAPATDIYQFRVALFGSWTGGSTWFGAGWWRGVDRLSNGYWQTQLSAPAPLGDHFEQRPTENTPSNYWYGAAMRPQSGDYDLRLYNRSWFDNPDGRQLLATSALAGAGLDFIMVDGNHWSSGNRLHYRVNRFSGSGAYQFSSAKHGTLFSSSTFGGGVYGPYTLNSIQSLFIADIWFEANSMRRIRLIPAVGSNDDLGLALYRSTPGTSSTWVRSRSQSAALSDSGGVGAGERIRYRYDGTQGDWLGLAVFNKTYNSAAEFRIELGPSSIFADGFQGD